MHFGEGCAKAEPIKLIGGIRRVLLPVRNRMPQNRMPLAITMGDPAGIGPEIIARLYCEQTVSNAVVLGDAETMRRAMDLIGGSVPITEVESVAQPAPKGHLAVLSAWPDLGPIQPGAVSAEAGAAAYAWIKQAAHLALEGAISGIVTAPVHKEALKLAGAKLPGHTEILADLSRTEEFGMMLANDDLRVMLVSIHISLAEALRRIDRGAELRAFRLAERGTRGFGIAKPRIAVAGLNPHAGENGQFGREEIEIIAPAIAEARKNGLDISGPYSPDTIFMRARRGEFDCVVAQYHDQGLIPIKYLGVENGVNITVGLPFVRTSVDHGTGFDIAWQGKADASSLIYAFKIASRMAEALTPR
jgi:4-hydroxythreonine-4-phosphate dehydrogenase